jgi:acyl transferase domain-containing protein
LRKTTRRLCALGSVKTNVGHLDAAAGVTGLVKLVLSIRNRQIPPSLHFEAPNPSIDFDSSPSRDRPARWPSGTLRAGGVSAFGVGGTNAHVILEEAPPPPPAEPGRAEQLLPVSAKTEGALEEAIRRLAAHLRAHPEADLADVAWTLRWQAHGHRCRACDRIQASALEDRSVRAPVQDRRERPVAFRFPGTVRG